jgi:hypothetical protein
LATTLDELVDRVTFLGGEINPITLSSAEKEMRLTSSDSQSEEEHDFNSASCDGGLLLSTLP